MKQLTIVQMLEQSRADDITVSIDNATSLPTDGFVEDEFQGLVEVVGADDDGVNHRHEHHRDQSYAD